MMKFESDLSTPANTTVIPTGTPDLLDEWYAENVEHDADWGDYFEAMFDPDCDPYLG